jgi:heme-degrading monooxygenase HmoA
MVRVITTYDIMPGADLGGYQRAVERGVELMSRAKGFVEANASRNALGSPHISVAVEWESLAYWGTFLESGEFQALQDEMQTKFIMNVCTNVWRQSPVRKQKIERSK